MLCPFTRNDGVRGSSPRVGFGGLGGNDLSEAFDSPDPSTRTHLVHLLASAHGTRSEPRADEQRLGMRARVIAGAFFWTILKSWLYSNGGWMHLTIGRVAKHSHSR